MRASRISGTPKDERRTSHVAPKNKSIQTQSQMYPNTVANDNRSIRRKKVANDNQKASLEDERKIRARQRRIERNQTPMTQEQKKKQGTKMRKMLRMRRRLRNALPQNTTTKRVRAISVSIPILIWTLPFWSIQFTFWIIGLGFIVAESIWVVKIFVPGNELYMFTWMVILFIGLGSLFYAVMIYTIRGVDCFGGWKSFLFILSIALYISPLLNLGPWIILWIIGVIYLQNEKEDDKQEQT